jgi:hypothetical protein
MTRELEVPARRGTRERADPASATPVSVESLQPITEKRVGLDENSAHLSANEDARAILATAPSSALQAGTRPCEPRRATFWKRDAVKATKKTRPSRRR